MDKDKLLRMGALATAAVLPALLDGPGRKPRPTPRKGGKPPMCPMPERDRAECRAGIEQAVDRARDARPVMPRPSHRGHASAREQDGRVVHSDGRGHSADRKSRMPRAALKQYLRRKARRAQEREYTQGDQ